MDVLVIIDMQEGLTQGDPKHKLPVAIKNINNLAARVRHNGGRVIFIQHDGPPGDDFAPGTPGWPLLSALGREPEDHIVHKKLNDAFFGTSLQHDLQRLAPERVLVAGWATDFCVDATIRTAAALGFRVVVVADGHTVADRPHLPAQKVIEHHHWVWQNLIAPHSVQIVCEADI